MTTDTRARLLDAAYDTVSVVGMAGLALEDVSAAAGVSRQTLYRHFGSRQGLMEALVVREEEIFLDRVRSAANAEDDADAAVRAGVREALLAAREHDLLQALLEKEPGAILPLMVLGRGPVISVARPAVSQLLAERLGIANRQADLRADVCSRLIVSYVLDDGGEELDDSATRIAHLVSHEMPDPARSSEPDGQTFPA